MFLENGKILMSEEVNQVGDQEMITETRKIPIFEGDKVSRVVTVIRNITERKRAEEAMIALQEQFRQSQKMEAIGTVSREASLMTLITS